MESQCQQRFSCRRCRCVLDAGHPGPCDQHCGQPLDTEALIRQAIADPGTFLPRIRTWDDGWEEWAYESIAAWGARAVVKVLTDHHLLREAETVETST